MRSYYKKAWTCTIIVIFILFFYTLSFAQYESIKGVQFKDGSIIYGKVIKMNVYDIQIETKDGQIISRKFDNVANFFKHTGIAAKQEVKKEEKRDAKKEIKQEVKQAPATENILQTEIRGARFKDGSVIYGTIIEMNIDKVSILTKDNDAITKKFDDIESFIKEAATGPSSPSDPGSKVGLEFNSGRLYLDVGLQSAYFKGDTTYHIDFPGGASELEFPLKTFLLGPNVGLSYKNKQNQEKFRLNVKWLTNIDDGSGKMKDSDWIDGDGHSGLDIYSESKIKLKANIIDVNLIYNFWPIKQLSIGPMLGYKYQNFAYDVTDLNQVGYGPYDPGFTGSVSGNVLDYKVTYHIPYFGLSSDILLGKKFQANIKLGYAPWASAKDRDDHILRYKISEGDTDGYAYYANLNANWNFLPHWFLGVGGEYMKIHTTGTQHQYFYAGPLVGITYDVDDIITSEQWLFSTMVTYMF